MDLLTNPYVIIVIVLAVIISNISLLKYTANAKFDFKKKPPTPTTTDEEQQAQRAENSQPPLGSNPEQPTDKKE